MSNRATAPRIDRCRVTCKCTLLHPLKQANTTQYLTWQYYVYLQLIYCIEAEIRRTVAIFAHTPISCGSK
jgi:hypothetical protein